MKKRTRIFPFLAGLLLVVALPVLWFSLRAHFLHRSAEWYIAQARADGRLGTYTPPQGFVPDKTTAIAIAVAAWEPIFGKEQIEREAPYQAALADGIWSVSGTMQGLHPGGTARALIRQSNGEILLIDHEL